MKQETGDENDISSVDSPKGREPPFSDFHKGVEDCINKSNGRVRNCGRSAFMHLRRAWGLFDVDKEMSALRAITAEEEAASALILALQQRRYPGADRISFRDHLHKTALTPFFEAVRKVLSVTDFAQPTIKLRPNETPPRVEVFFDMRKVGANLSEPLYAQPDEPLNFSVHNQEKGKAPIVHGFEEELREFVSGRGLNDTLAFLRREANLRNQLLYASDEGVPSIDFSEGFLRERLRRVVVLLVLAVAVRQTASHQLFVVQCLRAFLRILRKAEIEFPDECKREPRLQITVTREDEGEPTLSVRRSSNVVIGYRFLPIMHVGLT